MPSNHLILCHPLLLLPSTFPSIRVFSNESVLHIRWPKYWSFSISPSNEYSRLISLRTDWFDLLAFQGALKSLQQYLSLKASILEHLAFFMVQLSTCIHDYWKNHRSLHKLFSLIFSDINLTVKTVDPGTPGGLVVKTPGFHCRGHGFETWLGN